MKCNENTLIIKLHALDNRNYLYRLPIKNVLSLPYIDVCKYACLKLLSVIEIALSCSMNLTSRNNQVTFMTVNETRSVSCPGVNRYPDGRNRVTVTCLITAGSTAKLNIPLLDCQGKII